MDYQMLLASVYATHMDVGAVAVVLACRDLPGKPGGGYIVPSTLMNQPRLRYDWSVRLSEKFVKL